MQAIGTLHAEHRSLAAVMHGMLYLLRETRLRGTPPRFDVLTAMVEYIASVPERHHHPKEEAYLFRPLMARYPQAAPLVETLQTEHRLGRAMVRELEAALARYRSEGAMQFHGFAEAAAKYAALQWRHLRTEEDELLPLAREHLTAEDWQAVDAAFAGHRDPLHGAETGQAYESLFRRIVEMSPPPLGSGAR